MTTLLFEPQTCRCGEPIWIKKRGLCKSCYQTWWKERNPEAFERYLERRSPAICRDCNGPRPRGRSLCLLCKEKAEAAKLIRARAKRYCLTEQQYYDLVAEQDGRCAICKQETELTIDHDHQTSEVRGLLCQMCNSSIGKLGDNIESIRRVLQYLQNPTIQAIF